MLCFLPDDNRLARLTCLLNAEQLHFKRHGSRTSFFGMHGAFPIASTERVTCLSKVDLLPEITMTPLYRPPADSLIPASLRNEVQAYIATRQPASFPSSLARRMALSPTDTLLCDARYNVPMLNAFVFYVGLTVRLRDALSGVSCAPPFQQAPCSRRHICMVK